jgi:hypothetical protein
MLKDFRNQSFRALCGSATDHITDLRCLLCAVICAPSPAEASRNSDILNTAIAAGLSSGIHLAIILVMGFIKIE